KGTYKTLPVSVWAVLAGDAFKVITAALAEGKTTPEAMTQYLKTGLKEYPGLSGPLGFDAKGDRVGDFYRTYTVNADGVFVLQPRK
ncbi:MAG: branched-chain amino acid ABC transporter substrate-binding protein, partial [Desulfovibrionaceae bacterium]|nr:branched-chain amino acid ABC transporter substrate-binding protein [Desulfovibrionaceae bacterium]